MIQTVKELLEWPKIPKTQPRQQTKSKGPTTKFGPTKLIDQGYQKHI